MKAKVCPSRIPTALLKDLPTERRGSSLTFYFLLTIMYASFVALSILVRICLALKAAQGPTGLLIPDPRIDRLGQILNEFLVLRI